MAIEHKRRRKPAYLPYLVGAVLCAAAFPLLSAPSLLARLSNDGAISADARDLIGFFRLLVVGGAATCLFLWRLDRTGRALRNKLVVFLLPFVALALFAAMKAYAGVSNILYLSLVREDFVVEYIGAIAVLVGGLITFYSAHLARRQGQPFVAVCLLLLGAFMVWMGLEEVSYGQRLFGFGTPATLREANYQEEFNVHNVTSLEWLMDVLGPDLIVAWGLLGWVVVEGLCRIFGRAARPLRVLCPPWFLASFFVPYAIYANVDVCCGDRPVIIWQDQEPAEAMLEIAFFVYALWALRMLRQTRLRLARPGLGSRAAMSLAH